MAVRKHFAVAALIAAAFLGLALPADAATGTLILRSGQTVTHVLDPNAGCLFFTAGFSSVENRLTVPVTVYATPFCGGPGIVVPPGAVRLVHGESLAVPA